MKGKAFQIAWIFLLLAPSLAAQPTSEKAKVAQSLFQMLDFCHYSPAKCDSKFSDRIFDNVIKTIDPYSLFFTGEMISELSVYSDSLCSARSELTLNFVNNLTAKYRQQLHFADSIVDQCYNIGVNFSGKDSLVIELSAASKRPRNSAELKVRWQKWIKQGLLKGIFYSETDSVLPNPTVIADSLYAPASLLARKSRIREKRWIAQLKSCSGGIENFVMNSFLNCITSSYDPHTNYFSGNDKEKFESSLSKDNYAFGFELGSNLNDEVIISRILPGSPLWYSKKLEKGDVIRKIKLPGQDEMDFAFASIAEVDNVFNTLTGDLITMTVRKADGSIASVELTKGKFDTKENQTMGFLLKGERPVGYIWFSAFYTEFDRYRNMGCSIDFLKEMVKLKESGIEGLIIDLRNNPGGSESEAMEIAAYFVGNGPYAIRQNRDGGQNIIEKRNAVKWFDGPVVVMVDGSSASASELLSAVLQDYNRAVILGSNTFGKASEQMVFPVGQKMKSAYRISAGQSPEINDFVKVTCGKIYRITGKSYQKMGVVPDIVLPEAGADFIQRESKLPYALENDSIKAAIKFEPLASLPIDSLVQLSRARIMKNEKFKQVEKVNTSIKTLMNNTFLLDLQQYRADADKRKQLTQELKNLNSAENNLFKVENTVFKIKEIQSDSLLVEINEKLKDSVQKDIYVSEAFSSVLDMIGLKNSEDIRK